MSECTVIFSDKKDYKTDNYNVGGRLVLIWNLYFQFYPGKLFIRPLHIKQHPISSTDSEMTSKYEKEWEAGLLLRMEAMLRLQHKQVCNNSASFFFWRRRRQSQGRKSRMYQEGAICYKGGYHVLQNEHVKILNLESILNELSKRLFAIFRSLMHFKVTLSHYKVWNHKVRHGETITEASSII